MAIGNGNDPMQGSFSDTRAQLNVNDEGLLTKSLDPLSLDIDDKYLSDVFEKLLKDSRRYFENEHDLYARRDKNELYYFGRQIEDIQKEKLMKNYESKFMDNVLYEIEATIKPLAMSRLPDLIVTPGQESEESKLMADQVSKAIDTEVKSRQNRKVLGLAFKHLPVYFTGVIKSRWDNELDDYVFEVIHPDMIDVDSTSPSNNADDMKWISQILPLSVQEVIMRFPKKEEEFVKEAKKDGVKLDEEGKLSWKAQATVVKIREIWFTEYKKKSEKEWERVEGVMWKYYDCILGKMKNPNFDYEGENTFFEYDPQTSEKKPLSPETAMQALAQDQLPGNVKEEKIFHNYFENPRKPFFFMGYDQWGQMPYDVTSRLEQNLQNQKSLDKRGKQIEETLDNKGHYIWSKDSGLKPSDVEQMDMNDPDEDAIVDGNVHDVVQFIPPERPDPAEFKDLDDTRNRMYGISGSNAVRGNIQSNVATTNQIAREADFTRADDLVEDTINAAAEWMAQWAMQFVKLRYTQDHWKKILGKAGDVVFLKMNRNMVDEGMEVMIKASGTDKFKAQNNAMEMAKMKMIDPVNFYRDMGYPDYEERAKMVITFNTDPNAYEVNYIMNLETTDQKAEALAGLDQAKPAQAPMAQMPGQPPMAGAAQPPAMTPPPTAEVPALPPTAPGTL